MYPVVVSFICAEVGCANFCLTSPSSPWRSCALYPKHSTAHPVERPSLLHRKTILLTQSCLPSWKRVWKGLMRGICPHFGYFYYVGSKSQWGSGGKNLDTGVKFTRTYLSQLLASGPWVCLKFLLLHIGVNTNLTGLSQHKARTVLINPNLQSKRIETNLGKTFIQPN